MTIESFTGPEGKWFDNVRRLKQGVPIRGVGQARSVEQGYYMMRIVDYAAALMVMRTTTGISAKMAAEAYKHDGGPIVEGWANKVEIMLECIHAAVVLNPKLAAALEATGDEELVEGNDWGDAFWGRPFIIGPDGERVLGEGYNLTGRAWMMVRAIRRAPDYEAPAFADMVLDPADHGRFAQEAQQLLAEAGLAD